MKKLNKYLFKLNTNYEMYLYHLYHNIFWKSLLKKGLNLRSINFFYKYKYQLKQKENEEPWIIFLIGMINISILIFPLNLWVGGQKRNIGFPIQTKKQITLAKIWLINFCKENKFIKIDKLVSVLIDAFYDKGSLWQKKKNYMMFVLKIDCL